MEVLKWAAAYFARENDSPKLIYPLVCELADDEINRRERCTRTASLARSGEDSATSPSIPAVRRPVLR